MAAARCVIVGSISFDIYLEIDRLPLLGETVSASESSGFWKPGGKGANTSVACARSSSSPHTCAFIGFVGQDAYASALQTILTEAGVDAHLLRQTEGPTGSAYIFLYPSGDNSIIIAAGANANGWKAVSASLGSTAILRLDDETLASIEKTKLVALQREVPDEVNALVIAHARKHQVPVLLDLGGRDNPPPTEWLTGLFCLTPNETELARLTNLPCNTEQEMEIAARKLLIQGVKYVLITLGELGSILFSNSMTLRQPALRTKVIDSTGAGDAFRGAFCSKLVELVGENGIFHVLQDNNCARTILSNCMRFANAAGSVACESKGAMVTENFRSSTNNKLMSNTSEQ